MTIFGWPTMFVEDEAGLWWEYQLPKGKLLENGDKIALADCEKGIRAYRRVVDLLPGRSNADPELPKLLAAYRADIEHPDARIVLQDNQLVTLIPV